MKTVWYLGQNVKRHTGEPVRLFATWCHPLYSEFTDELAFKTIETKEWTEDKAVVAFYRQNINIEMEDGKPVECTRLLGKLFLTLDRSTYKRALLDTFANGTHPTRISVVIFANADSDAVNEMVVIAASDLKSKHSVGTLYSVKVYDKTSAKLLPVSIKRMDLVSAIVAGGFEGTVSRKQTESKHKNQKEVEDELKKAGYF